MQVGVWGEWGSSVLQSAVKMHNKSFFSLVFGYIFCILKITYNLHTAEGKKTKKMKEYSEQSRMIFLSFLTLFAHVGLLHIAIAFLSFQNVKKKKNL